MQRLTAKFTEDMPFDLVAQMIAKFCVDHPGRYLLRVRTEAQKFLLPADLNLKGCHDREQLSSRQVAAVYDVRNPRPVVV